ncbi:MAG: hypothetical protein LBC63_09580 [Holophagales bacterium]|jgi:hypothetical protein|nr:hypothetical protein [Holophagales bacterium]
MTARAILLCLLLPHGVCAQAQKQMPQTKAVIKLEVADFPKECSFNIQLRTTLYIVRKLPVEILSAFSQPQPTMFENIELGKDNVLNGLDSLSPHIWEISFSQDSKAIINGSPKNAEIAFPIQPNRLNTNTQRNGIILFEGKLVMSHTGKGSQTYLIKKFYPFSPNDQWILHFENKGVVTLGDDDDIIDRNISLLVTLIKKGKGLQL